MTSGPKLSRRLGRLFIFMTGFSLLLLTLAIFGVKNSRGNTVSTVPDAIEDVVFTGILAFLYTNSAVRMKRLGITSDTKPPAPLSSDLSKPKFPATS